VVNLASHEYSKCVAMDSLRKANTCVFDCVFKDEGRVVATYAKRARGLMARYIVKQKIVRIVSRQAFEANNTFICRLV
jgi:cytoplasmic iron level regulating protein YaaA (DUF328/UPF0246 family)